MCGDNMGNIFKKKDKKTSKKVILSHNVKRGISPKKKGNELKYIIG